MIVTIQRVLTAAIAFQGAQRAAIDRGLLVLVGITQTDTDADLDWSATKLAELRIFEDDGGKMNRSALDTGGSILLVSNFTLAGDARKGRRPSFDAAMRPELASPYFDRLAAAVAARGIPVQTGVFRAHMLVSLVNDGPVTIVLDSAAR
jgi:D-aminoacyl-tRNA deacylase